MHSVLEPKQTGSWEAISNQLIRFKYNTLTYRSTKISMRGHSFHCTVREFSISFPNHHLQSVRCRTVVCAKECPIINPFGPSAERVFIAIWSITNQITKTICSNKHLKIITPIARISNKSNIKKILTVDINLGSTRNRFTCFFAILRDIWIVHTCTTFLESIHGCPFDVVCIVERQVTRCVPRSTQADWPISGCRIVGCQVGKTWVWDYFW